MQGSIGIPSSMTAPAIPPCTFLYSLYIPHYYWRTTNSVRERGNVWEDNCQPLQQLVLCTNLSVISREEKGNVGHWKKPSFWFTILMGVIFVEGRSHLSM